MCPPDAECADARTHALCADARTHALGCHTHSADQRSRIFQNSGLLHASHERAVARRRRPMFGALRSPVHSRWGVACRVVSVRFPVRICEFCDIFLSINYNSLAPSTERAMKHAHISPTLRKAVAEVPDRRGFNAPRLVRRPSHVAVKNIATASSRCASDTWSLADLLSPAGRVSAPSIRLRIAPHTARMLEHVARHREAGGAVGQVV